jgi:hypothetical protein
MPLTLTLTLDPRQSLGQKAPISTPRKASRLVKGNVTLSRRHVKVTSPYHRPYLQPSTLFTPRMSVQALPTTPLSTEVEGDRCHILKATGLHMCISSVSHSIHLCVKNSRRGIADGVEGILRVQNQLYWKLPCAKFNPKFLLKLLRLHPRRSIACYNQALVHSYHCTSASLLHSRCGTNSVRYFWRSSSMLLRAQE